MTKTTDQKIDDLALAMAAGFAGVDKRFESIDKDFDSLNKRFDTLEKKVTNLPDKPYLDDKLADLKGDLVVKLRREDAKVNYLIDLLRERSVLTKADAERIRREFEIFPQAV